MTYHSLITHAISRGLPVVPVFCTNCGKTTKFSKPNRKVISELVKANDFVAEKSRMVLAKRAVELFARFPRSNHPLIISRLSIKHGRIGSKKEDHDFEAALEQDLELKMFLSKGEFLADRVLARIMSSIDDFENAIRKDGWPYTGP